MTSFPLILACCGFISFHFGLFVASFPFILAFLWLHFLSCWPFVASFTFILAFCPLISCVFVWPSVASFSFILTFCAFHKSVWFVLLRGQWLLPSYLPKRGGPMAGAISCLRGAYAALTRGELVASDKRNSQLQGHQIPQESQSLMFENII